MTTENQTDAVRLLTTRSDVEIAADLKARTAALMKPVCEAIDEAAKSGIHLIIQIGRDHLGCSIATIEANKRL